jgi:hypothetical protein
MTQSLNRSMASQHLALAVATLVLPILSTRDASVKQGYLRHNSHLRHSVKPHTGGRPSPAWTITRNDTALAVPYFHAANGGSDGSIVTARLAGAAGGVSDTRALAIAVTRRADSGYATDVSELVASW